jgi:hypothetical protein
MGVIYSFVEHITFLRSFYFTVINVTTVGFGDVVPFTRIGKLIAGFNSFTGLIIFGVLVATLTMALQPRQFSGEITSVQPEPPDEPLTDGLNKLFAGVGAVLTSSKSQERETDESNLVEPEGAFRVGITVHNHPRRLGRWGHIYIDLSVRNDA